MDGDSRYVIIHGHFYQPPRESPWTGLIASEPGAAPFANWNERILSESYLANAHAHIMDGSVVHIKNNYEALNFDFGPTLMSYLERHGKAAYRSVVRADALSVQQRGGHGNAIAQSYNHSILPLLGAQDKEVQLSWGIEDFVFRFGRRPEGIWLPECAADDASLAAVAASEMKFTILAPWQGSFTAEPGKNDDGAAGPFRWRSGDSSLAVFRFDRDLSGEISFGDALTDGVKLASHIADRALALPPGAALLLATDGETFGHHKPRGAAEIARAIDELSGRDDLKLVNCAQYLAEHPAAGSFSMNGATSWSCPHGIERWRSDCGCRLNPNTSQQWRAPLRGAMEFVKAHVDILYDRFASQLVDDPFATLNESIRIVIDPAPAVQEAFLTRHHVPQETGRTRLLRLMEMERAAHAAFTSCGWFFDDFGGPEGRIVLRWAARAVELAAELAPSAEPELLERLRSVHSNRREIGDAATLYLSLKSREARSNV